MPERVILCSVRVFRQQGRLLSRLAHDLELRLERFTVILTPNRVDFSFEPDALEVQGAIVDGRLDRDLFDADKKAEIEKNLRNEVLSTPSFPRARFQGSFEDEGARVLVRGQLELRGVERPIEFELVREGEHCRGEVTLVPSRWGIAPYQALFGALKLEDRVLVLLDVMTRP